MSSVAYTYSRALASCFEKEQEKVFFSFLEEFKQLVEVLSELPMNRFFLSPTVPLERKKRILKKVFDSFKVNDLMCSFLFLLLDKKRWNELKTILICLTDMAEKMKGVVSVEVESTAPLPLDLKEQLIKKLENFFDREILLKEKQFVGGLIGGVKLRAEGFVFDDTLLLHLTLMENQIRRNFYDYAG